MTYRLVVVPPWYVAPRVGEAAAMGRAIRRARCGHDVYVGARGLDAIGRRGKRLLCGRCAAALAAEEDAGMEVYSIDDAGEAPQKGRQRVTGRPELVTEALLEVLRPLVAELVAEELERREQAPTVEWLTVDEYAQRRKTTRGAVLKRLERGRIRSDEGRRPAVADPNRLRSPPTTNGARTAQTAEPPTQEARAPMQSESFHGASTRELVAPNI